jgi:hypothetical protein
MALVQLRDLKRHADAIQKLQREQEALQREKDGFDERLINLYEYCEEWDIRVPRVHPWVSDDPLPALLRMEEALLQLRGTGPWKGALDTVLAKAIRTTEALVDDMGEVDADLKESVAALAHHEERYSVLRTVYMHQADERERAEREAAAKEHAEAERQQRRELARAAAKAAEDAAAAAWSRQRAAEKVQKRQEELQRMAAFAALDRAEGRHKRNPQPKRRRAISDSEEDDSVISIE